MTPAKVRTIREERLGLSQEGLAAKLGENLRTVQRWESPKWPPPKRSALALLNLLNDFPALIRRLNGPS